MLQCGSNCSLARAMDGRIMRRGIISSCQSAATSEIVKHMTCVRRAAALYQVLDLYLYLFTTTRADNRLNSMKFDHLTEYKQQSHVINCVKKISDTMGEFFALLRVARSFCFLFDFNPFQPPIYTVCRTSIFSIFTLYLT